MTEAGWTSTKPTVAGWYWYQGDTDLDAVIVWVAPNMHLINLSHKGPVRAFDGKWLGPITPDSFQQGRVAGLREAARAICMYCNDPHNWAPMSNSGYHICNTPGPNHARCRATSIHALLAQQAQGGVGDDLFILP